MSRPVDKSQDDAGNAGRSGRGGRARRRKLAVGGAVVALGASAVIGGLQGTAEAAPGLAAVPYYCGTASSGKALFESGDGHIIQSATDFTKSSGCNDFNLVETSDSGGSSDYFLGYYESGSTWIVGSEGWVGPISNKTGGDWVLLSDVLAGTKMFAASRDYEDTIWVNY
jgi:hypothetical protein